MRLARAQFGLGSVVFYTAFAALVLWAVQWIQRGEPVQLWIHWLRTEAAPKRRLAAEALVQMGPEGRPAATTLIGSVLNDDDPEVRMRAAWALAAVLRGDSDPQAKAAARAALVEVLRDPAPEVRAASATALAQLGAAPRECVLALLAATRDEDERVREQALLALNAAGAEDETDRPAIISGFNDALHDAREGVRRMAALCIGQFDLQSASADGLPALIAVLGDPSASVRATVANQMGAYGPRARPAIPALIQALRDDDDSVRSAAVMALNGMGTAAPEAIPALIRASQDPNAQVRAMAARMLGQFGADAEAALPVLAEVAKGDERAETSDVRGAMERIQAGLDARRQGVSESLARLKDSDPDVRREAAADLGLIGSAAGPAVPALIVALDDRDASVRRADTNTLARLGPAAHAALPALGRVAERDPEEMVKRAATHARSMIGPGPPRRTARPGGPDPDVQGETAGRP